MDKRVEFPFRDVPNTAVITCCHIIEDDDLITFVSHDEDDGMWQFLCGRSADIYERCDFRKGRTGIYIFKKNI